MTVDGAYLAAYPYIKAKAACMSSDSTFLKLSEKKERNLQWLKLNCLHYYPQRILNFLDKHEQYARKS